MRLDQARPVRVTHLWPLDVVLSRSCLDLDVLADNFGICSILQTKIAWLFSGIATNTSWNQPTAKHLIWYAFVVNLLSCLV